MNEVQTEVKSGYLHSALLLLLLFITPKGSKHKTHKTHSHQSTIQH